MGGSPYDVTPGVSVAIQIGTVDPGDLGRLGEAVNELRAVVNLGSLFVKASIMTMQEPMFWGFVVLTLALIATWARVMQMIYRRSPLATAMFA